MNTPIYWLRTMREVLGLPAFSEAAEHAYFTALHDMGEEDLCQALQAWLCRAKPKEFPTPALLRAFIREHSPRKTGTTPASTSPTPEATPCP